MKIYRDLGLESVTDGQPLSNQISMGYHVQAWSKWRGPNGIDLEERDERRQIDRADCYTRETDDVVQDRNVSLT